MSVALPNSLMQQQSAQQSPPQEVREAPHGMMTRASSPRRSPPEEAIDRIPDQTNAHLVESIKELVLQETASAFKQIEVNLRREVSDVRRHAELQDAAIVKLKTKVEELSGQVREALTQRPTGHNNLSMERVTDCLKATAEVGAQCLALNTRLEGLEAANATRQDSCHGCRGVLARVEASEVQLAEMANTQSRQDVGFRELQKSSEVVLKMQSHKMATFAEKLKELTAEVGTLLGNAQSRNEGVRSSLRGIQALATEVLREHEDSQSSVDISRQSLNTSFKSSAQMASPQQLHFNKTPSTTAKSSDTPQLSIFREM